MEFRQINKGGWSNKRRYRNYIYLIHSLEEQRKKTEAEVKVEDKAEPDIDEYGIEHPLLAAPSIIYMPGKGISAYNITLKGQSHINSDTRCQDRSGIRTLPDKGIVIAAVADGVGSCALSDIGADCAVNAALEVLAQQLEQVELPLTGQIMGRLLRTAMNAAYDAVSEKADKLEVHMYTLQSTLTVGVYDGDVLYVAHAGDDGVVALLADGRYCLVTVRHKGEEASSVYPLQSKNTWQFGMTKNVAAFVMCTDGVLDGFVRNRSENERVFYPFIKADFETICKSEKDVQKICDERNRILESEDYRARITDDLTYLAVSNNTRVENMTEPPTFNKEKWDEDTKKYAKRREKILTGIL